MVLEFADLSGYIDEVQYSRWKYKESMSEITVAKRVHLWMTVLDV